MLPPPAGPGLKSCLREPGRLIPTVTESISCVWAQGTVMGHPPVFSEHEHPRGRELQKPQPPLLFCCPHPPVLHAKQSLCCISGLELSCWVSSTVLMLQTGKRKLGR